MAPRRKDESHTNGNGKGKIKFRYMDAERLVDFSVDNIAGDVSDGLHSIANALAGRVLQPQILQPQTRRKPLLAGARAGTQLEGEEIETPEEQLPEEEVLEAEEEEGADETPSKPKRDRTPKAPKLLSTPNLTEAKVPLADFIKQKNPEEMIAKYAVITVWYKEQFQINEMNIDRIFSAFKHLGLESKLPTDVEKPLKNLTYTKKWFEKAKSAGNYTINWIGESEVGKMGTGAAK
jgi:hypothetical protein